MVLKIFAFLAVYVGTVVAAAQSDDADYLDCLSAFIYGPNVSYVFNATEIPHGTGESITKSTCSSSDYVSTPVASTVFTISEETSLIEWFITPNSYGLQFLEHFLLKIDQYLADSVKVTNYLLMNVSGTQFINQKARLSWKCMHANPTAYKMQAKLWYLGSLHQCPDGSPAAKVNAESFVESNIVFLNPEYQEKKRRANMCLCSSRLNVRISKTDLKIIGKVHGFEVPQETPLIIQLIAVSSRTVVFKETVNNFETLYDFEHDVEPEESYYISARLDCLSGNDYPVICGRNEAISYTSQDVYISHVSEQHQSLKTGSDEDSTDIEHIVQVVFIVVSFGICITVEMALIFLICSCVVAPKKQFAREELRGKRQRKGKQTPESLQMKRIAIIFTKDSRHHVGRVLELHSLLINYGLETTILDEEHFPEMMNNWIDVAEEVVKKFGHIVFVASPNIYNTCSKTTYLTSVDFSEEEGITTQKQVLHKVPAVVLNALKTQKAWSDCRPPKVYLVYCDQTFKAYAKQMKKEFPSVFKIVYSYNRIKHENIFK